MRAHDLEFHPEPDAAPLGDPSINAQFIPQPGRSLVVDLGAGDDRMDVGAFDFSEAHSHLDGQQCACDLDESQIDNIVNDSSGIRIEIHDTNVGRDPALLGKVAGGGSSGGHEIIAF